MSNWINVKDKTPDHEIMEQSHEVLCYARGHYLVGPTYTKHGKLICESDETILEDVTHWMPLEPPNA